MKKLILSVLVLAAVAMSANAVGGNTATATDVSAKARLYKAITIGSSRGLQFGTIAVGADATGTIRVDSIASTSFIHSDANAALIGTSTQTSAEFTVTGQSGKTFALALPSSILLGENGATVNNFSSSFANRASATITDGSVIFYVGATLNYSTADLTGEELSGKFNVTVTYN
jgi:hypothetical protein